MPGALQPRLQTLSAVLWRQRELLELLLFKVEQERLMAFAGTGRWQQRAARETGMVLEQLVAVDVERALAIARVAPLLDIARDASIDAVASRCDDSWALVLSASAAALQDASREALASRDVRRVLMRDGHPAARGVLVGLAARRAGAA